MKNRIVLCMVLVLCLCFAGCSISGPVAENATAPEVIPAQTSMESETRATEVVTEPATETIIESTTIPTTEPPRVLGPDKIEGIAVTIENVSLDYLDQLPKSIKKSTTYDFCGFKDEFVLNESQVYAVVQFTITNQTAGEIKIADIHDDFLVELIYDDQYVYSADSDSWCFFKAESQVAVVSDMAGVGSAKLAPLTTKDVTVYIPCAREVSTELEKHLMVVFTSNYSGYENLEFIIR